jgi:cytochrome b
VVGAGVAGRMDWGERAHEAARAAAWSHRAERIRDLLIA